MTDQHENLIKTLRGSSAVRSLSLEETVYRILVTAKPSEILYPYYFFDAKEEKIRELDIYVNFHFDSGVADGSLSIQFLIECKDIERSHIVFSGPEQEFPSIASWGSNYYSLQHYGFQQRILETLKKSGLPYPIDTIRKKLEDITYSKSLLKQSNSRIWNMAPPVLEKTAFRETTIGKDRELDNSVLWKSVLALGNGKLARLGLVEEAAEQQLVPLRRYAHQDGMDKNINTVIEAFEQEVGDASLIYPIVVVRAGLYLYRNGEVTPVDHVRLRVAGDRFQEFWLDVIQYDKFPECMNGILKHYEEKFPSSPDEEY